MISLPPSSRELVDSQLLFPKLAADQAAIENKRAAVLAEPHSTDNREERARAVLEKKPVPPLVTRETQIEQLRSESLAIRDAKEMHAAQHKALLKTEEKRISDAIKPAVSAEYRKMSQAANALAESLRAIEEVERQLRRRGFGTARSCPVVTADSLAIVDELRRELRTNGY